MFTTNPFLLANNSSMKLAAHDLKLLHYTKHQPFKTDVQLNYTRQNLYYQTSYNCYKQSVLLHVVLASMTSMLQGSS